MNASLSLRTVLRRTFGIYAEQAPLLLAVALVLDGVVVLDRVQSKSSPHWRSARRSSISS